MPSVASQSVDQLVQGGWGGLHRVHPRSQQKCPSCCPSHHLQICRALHSSNENKKKKKKKKKKNYPHPIHQPLSNQTELADAGFFFAPTDANPDAVKCFLCGACIEDWQAIVKDPLAAHEQEAPSCPLVLQKAAAAEDEPARGNFQELLQSRFQPFDEIMVKAREDTFAVGWPHRGRKGWLCTTKMMAESGFVYTPTENENDHAECPYCHLCLDGWEEGDDPM
ncbi:hypothetical protein DFJ73DRAFT_622285 [Zopfochytrium polystomum]|nr:hypothetical protein DFJ73DRAFT_622285 [Zopfochytrium polystomum]